MKVQDLMSREVFSVKENHTLDMVKDIMSWHFVRHVPVVNDQDHVVGLLTHRDLLKAAVSVFAGLKDDDQRKLDSWVTVKELMVRPVKVVSPEADLREAAAIMLEEKIGCLPVVRNRKLVGIITEADFLELASRL